MNSKSIKGKTTMEIEESLNQSMSDGFTPTLAIVFLSVKQDRDSVCEILDKVGISIFGATSAGEFIDGEVGEESIAILLMEIDKRSFKILFEDVGEGSTREGAGAIGKEGLSAFRNPAFIVCGSGVQADGEMIIR